MLTVGLPGRAVLTCGVVLALTGCTSISRSNLDELQRVLPAPPTRPSLADCRVLQRDEANEGTLYCEQPCDLEGEVFGRVLANGQPLCGLDWHLIGRAADGTCVVTLRRIPVGGPYRVELEVRDADGHALTAWSADHVLVGDIWILAGQSNMEGRGDLADAETPSPLVCCYGLNERWSIAEEPLHWLNESLDPEGSEYSIERLADLLKTCGSLTPRETIQICLADLESFRKGTERIDDLTILVLRKS